MPTPTPAPHRAAHREVVPVRVVVIGGTGLIGRQLVRTLDARGHSTLAASPTTGVNTVTRIGLEAAVSGADVVVDVGDAPVVR